MRKELEIIQLIEKYLNNELSAQDKIAFEEKLNNNPQLKQEVEKQRLIQEGVQNVALKGTIQKAWKRYRLGNLGSLGGMLVLVAIAATVATFWLTNQTEAQYAENIKYALNESGNEVWADADELVPAQFFTVNAEEDNVIETEGGLVVAIPKGSLLQNGKPVTGNIEIEIKEALTPEDIVLSGLSTKSGDNLLETGGMFYFNARKDGENLTIDKENGVIVDVPTDDYKADMQLYDGIRKEDGSIDWKNPKPLETFLTTVDITTLDFYPPNYENKLVEMGKGDYAKHWKDSLYYSFVSDSMLTVYLTFWSEDATPTQVNANDPKTPKNLDVERYVSDSIWRGTNYEINPAKIKTIWDKKFNNTLLATKEFEERLQYIFQTCDDDILDLYVNNLDKRLSTIDSMAVEMLCRKSQPTEPPSKYKTYASGKSLFNNNCASCHDPYQNSTGPVLSGVRKKWTDAGEIENLYKYIQDPTGLTNNGTSELAKNISKYSPTDMTPQALYKRQVDDILDYIDYLNNPEEIWEIEIQEKPSLCSIFQNFALQNKGRVKEGGKAAKLLSEHYAKQAKAYSEALSKTQRDYWKQYEKLNQDLAQMSFEQQQKEIERQTNNFKEECELNLEEACKQLGIKKKMNWNTRTSSSYIAPITSTGWKNIDRAVMESVANRETLDYSYKGKRAVIKYETCEVGVTNAKGFENVMVYLMPRELNSFMRMPQSDNLFKENLNELIQYQLVAVGMKDDEVYYAKLDEVLPQKYSLTLEKTTKKELRKLLRKGNIKSVRNDVLDDVKFQLNSIRMNKEKIEFENMAKFRREIEQAIFPCATPAPALPDSIDRIKEGIDDIWTK